MFAMCYMQSRCTFVPVVGTPMHALVHVKWQLGRSKQSVPVVKKHTLIE